MKDDNINLIDELVQQINLFIPKIIETVQQFDSYSSLCKLILKEISNISTKYDLTTIENEVITVNGIKEYVDLVLYKEDESLLSIEICWTKIGKAITKLLANQSEQYMLISIFPDKSLPINLLKRFDTEDKIKLLHLPKVKIKNNGMQLQHKFSEYTNVDSPLERKFAEKLQEHNLNFSSQYAVYERSYTGNMKHYPKYIIDFVVKGEFCKLALECDGLYYHLRDFQRVYDTERDLWLLKSGFDDVLRFLGDEIRDNLDDCIKRVIEAVTSWDNYYRRKQQKSIIKTTEMDKIPNREDVHMIVNDLASPIVSVVNQINKREMKKDPTIVIRKIKQVILKDGFSNEIQLLYYTFPELNNYVNQTHGLFIGYNIPFVLHIEKSKLTKIMPLYFKAEKRILKFIILFEKETKKVVNMKSYVVINGWTGKIIESDILQVNLTNHEEENNAMEKQKFYVVWSGKQTGIFKTWDECKTQVHGVPGAKYKSFSSENEAIQAFQMPHDQYKHIQSVTNTNMDSSQQLALLPVEDFIGESISVDAACSGNPGDMEYKGVYTKNGKEIFHFGPIANGTNNIGEFLAIVHALALMKQKNSNLPVYSDSLTAISWVRQKKANTQIPRNESTEKIWSLIERAENWLKDNTYSNQILKWETKVWGEIKADFGRK